MSRQKDTVNGIYGNIIGTICIIGAIVALMVYTGLALQYGRPSVQNIVGVMLIILLFFGIGLACVIDANSSEKASQ